MCWKTEKQKSISIGSAQAEYIALSEAIRELVWLKNVTTDLNFTSDPSVTIYCDNLSAENELSNKRSKYIDIRYHYIRSILKESGWEI